MALESSASGASGLRRAVACAPLRALIVDDEGMVRKVLMRMLTARGVSVQTASTPREAHACFESNEHGPFDLLITDLMIPEGGGVVLAQQLTARRPSLRVLFVSGYAAGNETRMWQNDRARFLTKPFGSAELERAIGDLFPGFE
jgi:two-component system cell cycle sensor histidine kinase/response regulator CckA